MDNSGVLKHRGKVCLSSDFSGSIELRQEMSYGMLIVKSHHSQQRKTALTTCLRQGISSVVPRPPRWMRTMSLTASSLAGLTLGTGRSWAKIKGERRLVG